MCSGCWILPQNEQARLHWNSGSSSTSSGNFSRRRSFCLARYAAMRTDCLTGAATASAPLRRRGRELELHVLAGDDALTDRDLAEAAQCADDAVDELLRRRGARGEPDAMRPGQEVGRDLAGVLDERRGAARALGDLDQPPRVRRVARPDDEDEIAIRRECPDRVLPVLGGVADVARGGTDQRRG